MTHQPPKIPKKAKKPYVRPEIKQVPLKPEEAVLGGCKTGDSAGSNITTCTSPSLCFVSSS